MEGCMTCENYEFGCCDDGLTQASRPDKEACLKFISSRGLSFILCLPRVVVVRARDTAAASMGAWPRERTLWAAPASPGRTVAWSP